MVLYLAAPPVAYNLNENIERYAYETYSTFVRDYANELHLISAPTITADNLQSLCTTNPQPSTADASSADKSNLWNSCEPTGSSARTCSGPLMATENAPRVRFKVDRKSLGRCWLYSTYGHEDACVLMSHTFRRVYCGDMCTQPSQRLHREPAPQPTSSTLVPEYRLQGTRAL